MYTFKAMCIDYTLVVGKAMFCFRRLLPLLPLLSFRAPARALALAPGILVVSFRYGGCGPRPPHRRRLGVSAMC